MLKCGRIGHFRVPPGLCFKTRLGAQPLIWKSFFILMEIRKKGCPPSLTLKVRVFGTRKWPILINCGGCLRDDASRIGILEGRGRVYWRWSGAKGRMGIDSEAMRVRGIK